MLQISSVSESRSPVHHQSHLLPCNRPLDGTVITRPDRRSLSLGECPIDYDSGLRRRLRHLSMTSLGRPPKRIQLKITRMCSHGTTPHESDTMRALPRDTPKCSFAGLPHAFVQTTRAASSSTYRRWRLDSPQATSAPCVHHLRSSTTHGAHTGRRAKYPETHRRAMSSAVPKAGETLTEFEEVPCYPNSQLVHTPKERRRSRQRSSCDSAPTTEPECRWGTTPQRPLDQMCSTHRRSIHAPFTGCSVRHLRVVIPPETVDT